MLHPSAKVNELLRCTHTHNQPLLSLHKTLPVAMKRRQTSQTVKAKLGNIEKSEARKLGEASFLLFVLCV